MKITLHVTDIDSYVWFRRIESMTVEEMRGRLLRTAPANDQMRMGTAWHSILEDPPEEIDEIERDGFTFNVACDAEIVLPQIREVRACENYFIDGVEIRLTGKCDGASGNKITDHKLTFKPNPTTYTTAYQWRAYLDIFNADVFEYIIYSARKKKDIVTIHDVSTMRMYRYPGMESDLKVGIFELLQFIKAYVPEKLETA
ncbi:MAG: hypothetical protein GY841_15925 [FCB group bacterium]|nr:hypothetical protein [FCB group bacterium]